MKTITLIALAMIVFFSRATIVSAQGMMNVRDDAGVTRDDHTAREEAEGKEVLEKLQAKEKTCVELISEDYEALGEYFMGKMLGSSHTIMNQMMMQRLGEEGEEQMHEVMGRRMSGCEGEAAFPAAGADFVPMMNMFGRLGTEMMGGGMMGNWSNSSAFNNLNNPMSMMNFGFASFGGFGWFFMLLWWILIVVGIVALVRWLVNQGKGGEKGRALEILKERYAKGEIAKDEFEKTKRNIA